MRFSPPELTSLDVPDEWVDLVERLPSRGRIVVFGPTDSGKTAFCWWLAEELSSQGTVVLVDADLGQSRVGPPACAGWLKYGSDQGEFEFVGDVSPASRPATAVAATVRMALRGQRLADANWIVVDTTGYVDGPGAGQLKAAKAQLLSPATVIALGPPGRLDHLRWPWRGREEVRWLRLAVAPACRAKSTEMRREWRTELFREWLADSRSHEFALDHLALQHMPPDSCLQRLHEAGELDGLLVGLDDHSGVGLCVGLLEELDVEATYARVWAPPNTAEARGLRLGALRLHRDGSPRSEEAVSWQSNT